MRQLQTMAPLLLSLGVSLTACEMMGLATRPPTVITKIQLERSPISVRLACPPRPLPPQAETVTQRDVAAYLSEVIAWGEQCQAKLAELREALTPPAPQSP